MYQDRIRNISIKVILDKRYQRKSGLYSVRIQIIHQRRAVYYGTGAQLSIEHWNKLPRTRDPKLIKIRSQTKQSYNETLNAVESIVTQREFSFELLKVRLGLANASSINSLFEEKIKHLKSESRIGYALNFQCALRNIENFRGKNIPIDHITEQWLRDFEKHSLITRNHNTIGIQMRAIRVILNQAVRSGELNASQYPFGKGKYEIKSVESKKKH